MSGGSGPSVGFPGVAEVARVGSAGAMVGSFSQGDSGSPAQYSEYCCGTAPGEPLLRTTPYHEIAPHLVLMAFLHRVVNGGGSIEREYAIGSGRMDLCVRYRQATLAMELKVWRPGAPDPLAEGLEQLDRYLAGLGLDHGWLVIFDRRPASGPLADRTHAEVATSPGGRSVTVVRA
jgi:hypothetical protein